MSVIPAAQFTAAHIWEIRDFAAEATRVPGAFWSTCDRAGLYCPDAARVTAVVDVLTQFGYSVERIQYDEAHSIRVTSGPAEAMSEMEWEEAYAVVDAATDEHTERVGRDICGLSLRLALVAQRALVAGGWACTVLDGHYPDGGGPLRILAPRPVLVVTRHAALVEYLRETGVVAGSAVALAHVESPEQIRGRRVVGVLPLHLASVCQSVTEVPMSLVPADREAMQRGDLTLERVREVAGAPQTYRVSRVAP